MQGRKRDKPGHSTQAVSVRTKEGEERRRKEKGKAYVIHVMGRPIDGVGVGQDLHINAHSTEQLN